MQDVDDDPMTWEESPKRPDPLQLALTAIGDFDRLRLGETPYLPAQLEERYQRAQLRVRYAQAMELRRIAVVLERMVSDGVQRDSA